MASILFLIGLSLICSTCIGRIGPIPSGNNTINAIVTRIKKYDNGKGSIADIGSGYGFLLFRLAKAFPNRNIIGYEISIVPYLISMLIKIIFRHNNVSIAFGDAFKKIPLEPTKISSAVAYFHSLKSINDKLENIATNHVLDILIINTYQLTNLTPFEISEKLDIFGSTLYIYRNHS